MHSIVLAAVLIASTGGGQRPSPQPSVSPSPLPYNSLFSRRALRNARLIIQLRLLQLREERLDCVRAAILRNLPPDLGAQQGSPAPSVKQSDASHANSLQSEDCRWILRYRRGRAG
ncbi:MAG: hypothetical protein JO302_02065 [Candidatus Eremiobacteraeota bacterium]|nr:hypothetical protein [Candidatus Eremiobacteraeota bacterium]